MNILVVMGHYLPGYRAGGPIRTLAGLIQHLGEEFQFKILTRDRDLGDSHPYAGIKRNVWLGVGGAQVMYLSPGHRWLGAWRSHLNQQSYDLIYLNSFFDRLSVQTMLLHRYGQIPTRPVLLAPRGEFSQGALALKRSKKRLYISLSGKADLYREVLWQATSEQERDDIARVLGRFSTGEKSRIALAPNLSPRHTERFEMPGRHPKEPGSLRVVFLSRVARKKNLDFALRQLSELPGIVYLDIHGPLENQDYWRRCQSIIDQLPSNIVVEYRGPVPPEKVSGVFASSHALFLPTRGENFGHVILEALSAGCPVLISDRTPWRRLAQARAGWDLPLDREDLFRAALIELLAMDQEIYDLWSQGARKLGSQFTENPALVEANRQLFLSALERK